MASEAEPRDAQSQVALHEGALDDGALHMAIVLGTITSGMLNVDDSVEIADATSYEDYGVELYEDDVSFLELELAAEEPFVPEWETHIVEPGETFAVGTAKCSPCWTTYPILVC